MARAVIGGLVLALTMNTSQAETKAVFDYPESRRGDVVDVYHDVEVNDPYRWLEADVRESEAVREWVDAQKELTFSHLATLPHRETIEHRLRELWNYERYSVPTRAGKRYFYSRNDGLQNHAVVYVQDGLEGQPRAILDPNTWSEDGTVALAAYAPSPDGRYVAYGIQEGGSDWRTWRVLDVETGEVLPETLEWLKFTTASWRADGRGFYYSRYPVPAEDERFQALNYNQQVWYHEVGTPQTDDRIVYARPDQPDWGFGAEVTEDGRWLVITVWRGTDDRYRIYYRDLEDDDGQLGELVGEFENDYTLIGNDGDVLYFRTNLDAPRGRIVAVDVGGDEPGEWREIVPESTDVLQTAVYVQDRFLVEYLSDVKSLIRVFGADGEDLGRVELPGIGSVTGLGAREDDDYAFFTFSSYNRSPTIYRYDVKSGDTTIWRSPEVDFDPDDYVVRQVFYSSKDGTLVPMFVAHRRDLEIDGDTPTLLYGYGGFNISLDPEFSVTRLAWLEMGGIYAVANLRGGGEYGRAWHDAGKKLNKQNVFDDFIAAAEWLIDAGYTRSARLAIMGRSNGGLLVGAVTNQRPELFGVALPGVGVMDMLRYHRFTAGRFWVDDYGSSEDPEEFRALYAYSPYHNVEPGTEYPAVLINTADTDDRVVPAHSFKYAAAMQAAQAAPEPVLIRIETSAGHGAGTPTEKLIEEYADVWAFTWHHLGGDTPVNLREAD